jgi:hypothetical protein
LTLKRETEEDIKENAIKTGIEGKYLKLVEFTVALT